MCLMDIPRSFNYKKRMKRTIRSWKRALLSASYGGGGMDKKGFLVCEDEMLSLKYHASGRCQDAP